MLTTLLNPTLWLLAATGLSAGYGLVRRQDARQTLDRVIRVATLTPVLAVLVLMAGGGLASRIVLGFMSPGAYAEEVLGARAFLSGRGLYEANARQQLGEWIAEAATPVDPWTLPGITPCQSSAFSDRARYYTSQGHLPTMLLASVPVVTVAGGQGLYVVIAGASCAALMLAAALLSRTAAIPANSRRALLILSALAGWQPVLASVRQGEALVVVAALSVVAWTATRTGIASGVSGGVAAMMTLPALTIVPALLGSRFKAGVLACMVLAGGTALAMAVGGATILQDFIELLVPSATTYAQAANNYAVIGRALGAGRVFVAIALGGAAIVSLWRGRSSDASFGAWLALGLLATPIVWSQHLTLALVPLAVLLRRVLVGTSALALVGWSVLATVISAPDPLVAKVYDVLVGVSPSLTALPAVSVALVLQWIWIVAGRDAVASREARTI